MKIKREIEISKKFTTAQLLELLVGAESIPVEMREATNNVYFDISYKDKYTDEYTVTISTVTTTEDDEGWK